LDVFGDVEVVAVAGVVELLVVPVETLEGVVFAKASTDEGVVGDGVGLGGGRFRRGGGSGGDIDVVDTRTGD
jgi:hypothetical protein